MTIEEAKEFVENYIENVDSVEEYLDVLKFLCDNTDETRYMMELGGYYYERKKFDLAEKYYLRAAELNNGYANVCLGYIYYYGRVGQPDYKKAFEYYSKAMNDDYIEGVYKVADMYKKGLYVEKDVKKYEHIIRSAYDYIENKASFEPYHSAEIYMRMGHILEKDGNLNEAAKLYYRAMNRFDNRLAQNPFFGDISNMNWAINSFYHLCEVDYDDIGFYDMMYLLRRPCKIKFEDFDGNEYEIKSEFDFDEHPDAQEGDTSIFFNDKWYRSILDFYNKCHINGEHIIDIKDEFFNYKVVNE